MFNFFIFNFCYRTEFVDKYLDYILNKSVEEAFEEFKRGFFKACDKCIVEMFEPEELRGVLVGNEEYDWDILKQVHANTCQTDLSLLLCSLHCEQVILTTYILSINRTLHMKDHLMLSIQPSSHSGRCLMN